MVLLLSLLLHSPISILLLDLISDLIECFTFLHPWSGLAQDRTLWLTIIIRMGQDQKSLCGSTGEGGLEVYREQLWDPRSSSLVCVTVCERLIRPLKFERIIFWQVGARRVESSVRMCIFISIRKNVIILPKTGDRLRELPLLKINNLIFVKASAPKGSDKTDIQCAQSGQRRAFPLLSCHVYGRGHTPPKASTSWPDCVEMKLRAKSGRMETFFSLMCCHLNTQLDTCGDRFVSLQHVFITRPITTLCYFNFQKHVFTL